MSPEEATIEINTAEESVSFTLLPGQIYQREFDEILHPIQDVENKAIRIRSSNELQVLMYKSECWATDYVFNGAYMVAKQKEQNNLYFTAADPAIGYFCSSGNEIQQFYLITSFFYETSIHVVQKDGMAYSVDLPEFGTLFQKTTSGTDFWGIGTRIMSDKSINVVSGNLCVRKHADSLNIVGTYISNIPPVYSLGQQYILPKIIHEDLIPPGYSVSVVATADNTTVNIEGEEEILDQGDSLTIDYHKIDQSVSVNCSEKCLVVQYSLHSRPAERQAGMFMMPMLPDHEFSIAAYFTTLDVYPTSYVSLVIKGESPGDDLYLNGTSLGYLNWTATIGYSTAELAIPRGVYQLESAYGRPFAAYIYLHMNSGSAAAGYTLLPMETYRVTSSPTTIASTTPTTASTSTPTITLTATPTIPIPSVNSTLPQHTACVNGTVFTEDGEDISPLCMMVSTPPMCMEVTKLAIVMFGGKYNHQCL